ncbi:hypothetical protein KXW14_004294 [Aspergillus fumigatus]|nr:hypothetical protein KXW69_008702 [Aspergillus fumigatus]KAH2026747.1 hypothetical protein KXV43_000907 [Aspergillus fumigatus]KAH2249522.1 hypothetical protein KXW14_004294 [Aspergillus fumigatus]KAH2541480.1 hypothetical protein KXW12_008357 [Aspergillus fumigatus]KAH3211781.1 hypothetical protein KXV86_004320 [Aspergillus fumigatus]
MVDQKELLAALEVQHKRDNRPGITRKAVAEIKSSAIFQVKWEDLLKSAPISINALGAALVASSSETATTIEFTPPKGGFKFLQFTSLRANLVDCSNRGRLAFLDAEDGMLRINNISHIIYDKVAEIIQIIGSPDPADVQKMLVPQLRSVKKAADECHTRAVQMDKKFEEWLWFAADLHSNCVQEQSSNEERLLATKVNMSVAQRQFDSEKNTVEEAKKISEKLGKQLDVTSEAYKKASDSFPSGWDILGQQIVGELADTLTTALGQAITAYTSNLNPVARAEKGVEMFEDVVNGGKNAPKNGEAPPPPPPAPPKPKSPLPQYSDDPAYVQVKQAMVYLTVLNALLTSGKDGGVNWESAVDSPDKPDKTASFTSKMLKYTLERFEESATENPPSQKLLEVLQTATEVANAVTEEAAKLKDISKDPPKADSQLVKGWQEMFHPKYLQALRLAATAKTIPGVSSGGAPLMATTEDPAVQIAKTNAKSAQAQAVLDAAKDRLHTTQQTFLSTQKIYQEASSTLIEQENKLTAIQAELQRQTKLEASLTEIKSVLRQCISLVMGVKDNIMQLCRFFRAISSTIDVVVEHTVDDFIETISSGASDVQTSNFTLSVLQKSMIYKYAVILRAYFETFGDIATMWKELSEENIIPGLKMIDGLSVELTKDQMATKVAELSSWSQNASANIVSIASAKRKEIEGGMEERVEDIAQSTQSLPPSPPAKKAIEEAANEVTTTATTAVKENAQNNPLSRFEL